MKRIRRLTTTRFASNTRLKPVTTRTQNTAPRNDSNFDRLISRISHIAQTGLFILIALTLYYTVIPLYKTALLEEQISKKEIELKELEARRGEQYINLKNITLESFVARNIRCFLDLSGEDEVSSTTTDYQLARVLNIDIEACILNAFDNSPDVQYLNQSDIEILKLELISINNDIKILREKYIIEFEGVSITLADKYPLPKPDSFSGRAISVLNKQCDKLLRNGIPCDQNRHTNKIKIDSEKIRIENEFREKAIERFKKIWNLRSKTQPNNSIIIK